MVRELMEGVAGEVGTGARLILQLPRVNPQSVTSRKVYLVRMPSVVQSSPRRLLQTGHQIVDRISDQMRYRDGSEATARNAAILR